MTRLPFALMLAIGSCASSPAVPPPAAIALPDDPTELPPGPNVDIVAANCTGCHSPAMILTQPRLTRAEWQGEISKMQKVYKAPVDASDVPAIVDYLVATNARVAR